jgi:lipopolysaccharide biosynthesis regulator YciM
MELLILLLPVAAASGWLAAKRSQRRAEDPGLAGRNPTYFQGLNYLLNEQPDKAIDVFVKLIEVDSETVETHLALGNLFRRRGEVDRAIRIHQNLIARPTLSRDLRAQALLELGLDYMRAGLFDRAESLFNELADDNQYCEQSLRNLLVIYQQEKDWEQCLLVAERLESQTKQSTAAERAHFHCELAEVALAAKDTAAALQHIERARAVDSESVRPTLMQGNLEVARGDCRAAVKTFERVETQDPDLLTEVLPALAECYRRLGESGRLRAYLQELYAKRKDIASALALAEQIEEEDGEAVAAEFITEYLGSHPNLRGLQRLISLQLSRADAPAAETLNILRDLVDRLLRNRPAYQCAQCGFTAKQLHWNCPGCKTWGSMRPVQGFEAELR